MKKIVFAFLTLTLAVQPVMAKNIKVEAMSDFSTANPPKIWQVKVVETIETNGFLIEQGSVIRGNIEDVVSPKRLKRNASFVFVPTSYKDAKTGTVYAIKKPVSGKYSFLSDVSVGAVAKQGAVYAGNKLLDGIFGPGIALVEGAVKNEQGNRAKSAAVSLYESTPLSYANKGEEINIPRGTVFVMSFKEIKEEKVQEPNYTYTLPEENKDKKTRMNRKNMQKSAL